MTALHRRTIALSAELDALLLELARARHGGNVSAAVAELVTKCGSELLAEATARAR